MIFYSHDQKTTLYKFAASMLYTAYHCTLFNYDLASTRRKQEPEYLILTDKMEEKTDKGRHRETFTRSSNRWGVVNKFNNTNFIRQTSDRHDMIR